MNGSTASNPTPVSTSMITGVSLLSGAFMSAPTAVAVSPPHQTTNGHGPTPPTSQDDQELTKLLPDIPPTTFPFGELLDRTVQVSYLDLLNLAETLPSANNDERKKQLLHYCFAKRKLFTKLLVLLRANSKAKDILTCQKVHAFIDNQDNAFARAADDLFAIHNQMRAAKIANFDIQTAVDVLTTGAYQRLSKSLMPQLVPDAPLTSAEIDTTIERLGDLIRMRLMFEEVIPIPFRQNMKIEKGCVVFTVAGELTVTLTMVPDGSPQPWRVVDLQILSQSVPTGYGAGSVPNLQTQQIQKFKETAQKHLMEDNSSYWPIVRLYEFIHKFNLTYQLHILSSQATYLSEDRWKDYLNVEKSESFLKLDFWRHLATQNVNREYYQLHISGTPPSSIYPPRSALSSGSPDDLQKEVCESLSRVVDDETKNNSLKISLFGIIGTTIRNIDIPDHIFLNTEALDVEELLLKLTDHQSRAMICAMRDELLSPDTPNNELLGPSHYLFTEDQVRMSPGVSGDINSTDMPSSFSPTKNVSPAASLLVMYRPSTWIRLSVNPRTGVFIANLADESGLGSLVTPQPSSSNGMNLGTAASRTISGSNGHSNDSISRNLKTVEDRINASVHNTKPAIMYLRRATTITQVETMALYLGLEVADFVQIGTESPLKHIQTDEVRMVHLRFPGKDHNILVIAAGSHEDMLEAHQGQSSLRKSAEPSMDYGDAEFHVWIMSLKIPQSRFKRPEFQVIPLFPADIPDMMDGTAKMDITMSDMVMDKDPFSKPLNVDDSHQAWSRIDLPVLSRIQAASSNLFAFAKLIEQLDGHGLTYQFLVRNGSGLIAKGQTHIGGVHISRLDPKVVISIHSFLELDVHQASKAKKIIDSNSLDPRSQLYSPKGTVYLYLEPTEKENSLLHTSGAISSTDLIDHHTHRVVAKMRIPSILLPSSNCPEKAGEYIEYQHETRTLVFKYPNLEGFADHFLSEFQAIGNIFRLLYQLSRHKSSLQRMDITVSFSDLHSLLVTWPTGSIMRTSWETKQDVRLGEGSNTKGTGDYLVTFERSDGSPDGNMPLSTLATVMLNKTREIFPLVQIINRVSRLVSSLEQIRERRHAFGQIGVSLEVLSLTHYRVVFPYFSKQCGLEFVIEHPSSFLMFDGSMLGYALEFGLGNIAGVGMDVYGDESQSTIHAERTLRPLPEFMDIPSMSIAGMEQMRPSRNGLLSSIRERVVEAGAALTSRASSIPPVPRNALVQSHQEANLADVGEGALVQLPHGILCTLSLVDIVMLSVEGYLDVMCSTDVIFPFLQMKPIMHTIHEEPHCRILYATESAKAALTCQANGRWGFVIAPTERTLDNKSSLTSLPDSKAWLDKLISEVNAIPIRQRNSLEWLKTVVTIAMIPEIPLRELMNVCRVAQALPQTRPMTLDWVLQSPADSPAHLPPPGDMSFIFDRDIDRIRLLYRFTDLSTNESVLIPIRYNFGAGLVSIWHNAARDVKHPDLTEFHPMDPKLEPLMKTLTKTNLTSLSILERTFVQASIKQIPPAMGGPGKLFAVIKHLTSRSITELRGGGDV
ncbi:hypothetical protein BASA60_007403 [Batrachochytrium salamandrivorans]|nr:hypothetical protein BASA62_004669 [Batrachochytrium salamandrivorans]KAH6570974.1 hypothetical protein BASA60_007403 [Batrachochytrium salamandrivorans]